MGLSRTARVAVSAMAAAWPALAGLPAAPHQCGELQCVTHQYCSGLTKTCEPCKLICQPESNNYQQSTCETSCQDYLHDELYQSRYNAQNITAAVFRLEGDLHRLTIMVGVMFFLFVVCFIGFAFYACSSYRAYCRRRKTADIESGQSIELKKIGAKLANGSSAPAGQHVISPKASTVPQCTLGRQCTPFTLTAKPGDEAKGARNRHPSEDTCPGEYSAVYDNPALAVTPPLAAGGATGHPLASAASTARSRDSVLRAGSSAASSVHTESTRMPREMDITDMSPARTVEVI